MPNNYEYDDNEYDNNIIIVLMLVTDIYGHWYWSHGNIDIENDNNYNLWW